MERKGQSPILRKEWPNWFTNPTTFRTLNLLAQIYFSQGLLTTAEIIEKRNGGVYPTRTIEELEMLVNMGFLNVISEGNISKYQVTSLGKNELSLQGIMPRSYVVERLDEAKKEIENHPPSLPAEQYGFEEFRFTWESIFRLMEKIYEHNAYRRINIGLIGAPMVAFFMHKCRDLFNNIAVFDINPKIVDIINDLDSDNKIIGTEHNAIDSFPQALSERYDAVIIDPPWHNEHYALFADRAWEILRPYGRLYMSTFAPATRPEANNELSDLYRIFMEGGYQIISIIPEFFNYAIPDFERRVFLSQGIDVRSRGAYGQLVVLEKVPNRTKPCLNEELASKLKKETVIILDLDGTKLNLWLDENFDPNAKLQLEVANEGDTLSTTSRSERRRLGINVITSDHTGYRCSNPQKLQLIYQYYIEGKDPSLILSEHPDISAEEVNLAYQFFKSLIK
jgi:hypothetical protein